ncbi:MAG: translation elongation factor Ts [SAR86 cluster bacterium]|jgi:elongation factor Ts|nr:translation elongation factor Ts [SAR86 cluster bacterium]
MTEISASQVKDLREKTGLGLMDCKKALQDSSGDIELAIVNLRKSSALKAEKKSTRSAAEGIILAETSKENKVILIEVNCETDFVSKDKNFIDFCEKASIVAKSYDLNDGLLDHVNQQLENDRESLIQKIGENILIRKVESIEGEVVNFYIHSNNKIASAVSLNQGSLELGKDIAMHIAAANPLVVSPKDLSQDLIDKELDIIRSQVSKENKPAEIQEKMVTGRLNKYLSEVSLLKQGFVKDPGKSVEAYLKENNGNVSEFIRLEVGQGIEKEEVDFATEVMSQISDSE